MKIYKYFLPLFITIFLINLNSLFVKNYSLKKNIIRNKIIRKNNDELNQHNNYNNNNDDNNQNEFDTNSKPEIMQCMVEFTDEFNIKKGDNWLIHIDTIQYVNSELMFPTFKYFLYGYPGYVDHVFSVNCVTYDNYYDYNITCIECIKFYRGGKFNNGLLQKIYYNNQKQTLIDAQTCLNQIQTDESLDNDVYLRTFCLSFKF